VLYNLSVAREFLKQVYIREKLAPPTSLSTVTSTYSTLFARARNLSYWREIARTGEWATIGVIGLEAYFIFHIGEMIGRRSIVGYKLDEPKTH
jgi:F-type H+-transporting ATPase subunit g